MLITGIRGALFSIVAVHRVSCGCADEPNAGVLCGTCVSIVAGIALQVDLDAPHGWIAVVLRAHISIVALHLSTADAYATRATVSRCTCAPVVTGIRVQFRDTAVGEVAEVVGTGISVVAENGFVLI